MSLLKRMIYFFLFIIFLFVQALFAGDDSIDGIIEKYSTLVLLISYSLAGIFGIKNAWKLLQGDPDGGDAIKRWAIGVFFILAIHSIIHYLGMRER